MSGPTIYGSNGKEVFTGENPALIKSVGSTMEYYQKSTDIKPTNSLVPVGAVVFEIDTEKLFMNDGTIWKELS